MVLETMFNYSIMPLDTDHLDAICEDIRRQYADGVADCALFNMTLVPEEIRRLIRQKFFARNTISSAKNWLLWDWSAVCWCRRRLVTVIR